MNFSRSIEAQLCISIHDSFFSKSLGYEYNPQKNRLEYSFSDMSRRFLRLPIGWYYESNQIKSREEGIFVIFLIQSGSAALGLFNGDEVMDHKVFKSYMVRKKQGKSQLKYLKTKGKSRAGSRVRLGNALEFFENINSRLNKYFEENTIDTIAYSCSKTLWPFLFNGNTPPPFSKKDDRLWSIPRHTHTPDYDQLIQTYKYLLQGEILMDKEIDLDSLS